MDNPSRSRTERVSSMSTSSPPAIHGQKAIEVETKFSIPPNVEASIKAIGGTLLHEKKFKDVYYDTKANHFYLKDYWLRKRVNSWELKCPSQGLKQLMNGATQYVEVEDEAEIIHELQHVLPGDIEVLKTHNLDDFPDDDDLDTENQNEAQKSKWGTLTLKDLTDEYLVEIAAYVTERKTFRIEEYLVVLDQADFGYRLGEIEKVVTTEDEAQQAREGIDKLAERLGIDVGGPRVPGKIHVYIREKNPKLFEKLQSRRVPDGKMDAL